MASAHLMTLSVSSFLLTNVEALRRGTLVSLPLPLKMFSAPPPNGLNEWTHGFSVAGDAVLNSRRDFRINGAAD